MTVSDFLKQLENIGEQYASVLYLLLSSGNLLTGYEQLSNNNTIEIYQTVFH